VADFTNRFQIVIITDAEMGPNRTFQRILLSYQTQIDLLISSWLTLYQLKTAAKAGHVLQVMWTLPTIYNSTMASLTTI